jgi:hypothetical protein
MIKTKMFKSILFVGFMCLPLAPVVADEVLNADQVKALFTGKTVNWENHKKGHTGTGYFSPDGKLTGLKNGNVKIQHGWHVSDDGGLCIEKGSDTKCRVIEKSGDEIKKIKVKPNGKRIHIMTYSNFVDGNPNNF